MANQSAPLEPAKPEVSPRVRRRSASFTKRDVTRAVEAVKAAGLQIAAVRIEPDGTIHVVPGAAAPMYEKNDFD